MTDSEKLFNETFWRYHRLWASVSSFRDVLRPVLPGAEQLQARQAAALYDNLTTDPTYMKLLTNPEEFAKKVDRTQFVAMATALRMKEVADSLDAATVVFAHSVLDGSAMDYCRVIALHAPRDWERDLERRSVSLSEVRKNSYEELLSTRIEDRLEELERKSLLEKIACLHEKCQPPAKWSPMRGYEFDRTRIEQFDQQRHEIIHGGAFSKPPERFTLSDDTMFYLMRTGMYFMGLVNFRYGLQIDAGYIAQFVSARA